MAWSKIYLNLLNAERQSYTDASGVAAKKAVVERTAKAIREAHKASGTTANLPKTLEKVSMFFNRVL
jgi:hypothetical protein